MGWFFCWFVCFKSFVKDVKDQADMTDFWIPPFWVLTLSWVNSGTLGGSLHPTLMQVAAAVPVCRFSQPQS